MQPERVTSSFRDPSGYVFMEGDSVRRAIFPVYFPQYKALKSSGFFEKLIALKYLIPHSEISASEAQITLAADPIPFVSYPYEWSFPQYKHAALLTLRIQKLAIENGFMLKDASAFNVTFYEGRPVFVDTLSFDFYEEDMPWRAYGQFIRHFLGPLVLSGYYGTDFLKSLASDIDGIPLKKLSLMLPFKSRLSPTLLTNIHLLARYEGKFTGESATKSSRLPKKAQLRLLDSLYNYIQDLDVRQATEWDHYYNQTNYEDSAYRRKLKTVSDWFEALNGRSIIDIGGNDGTFSRQLKDAKLLIVPDVDANAVGQNYRKALKNKETNNYPVVIDVLNPSPSLGFANEERFSFSDRIRKLGLSGCLALAVIHHITLSGNVPFSFSAKFFAGLAPDLLIEFPTREDSWVQFLLDSKREFRSHFDFYNEEDFEKAYSEFYEIIRKEPLESSHRTMYTMKRKPNGV